LKRLLLSKMLSSKLELQEKQQLERTIKWIYKQMNEKDRIQRTFLQEKMYEERAAKLAELEY